MTHPDDTDEDKKFLTTEMVDEIHTRLEARRVDQEQKKLEKKLKKGKKGAKRNPSVMSRAPQKQPAEPDHPDSRPVGPRDPAEAAGSIVHDPTVPFETRYRKESTPVRPWYLGTVEPRPRS
ncbi:hypothetical protein C8F01DRAFT_1086877 [Mycena amicta]|nr:hypothetical protein C8F01DRAFT_1086877 [Mycena amicta]